MRITGSWKIGTNARIQRARRAFNAYTCRPEQDMEAGEVKAEQATGYDTTERDRDSGPDRAQQFWRGMREQRVDTGPVSRLPAEIVSARNRSRRASPEHNTPTREAALLMSEALPSRNSESPVSATTLQGSRSPSPKDAKFDPSPSTARAFSNPSA